MSEPMPFSDFLIARARTLAACWRSGPYIGDIAGALSRLRTQGERLGLVLDTAAIDAAIEQIGGSNVRVATQRDGPGTATASR
jgi:hypothetical protein